MLSVEEGSEELGRAILSDLFANGVYDFFSKRSEAQRQKSATENMKQKVAVATPQSDVASPQATVAPPQRDVATPQRDVASPKTTVAPSLQGKKLRTTKRSSSEGSTAYRARGRGSKLRRKT